MRELGSKMGFTGGAEPTPFVTVTSFNAPGSMHHGDTTFMISHDPPREDGTITGSGIMVSPETMRAILAWYENTPKRIPFSQDEIDYLNRNFMVKK